MEGEATGDGRLREQRQRGEVEQRTTGTREKDDLLPERDISKRAVEHGDSAHLDEDEKADFEKHELLRDALANHPVDLLSRLALRELEIPHAREQGGAVAERNAQASVQRIIVARHVSPVVRNGVQRLLE